MKIQNTLKYIKVSIQSSSLYNSIKMLKRTRNETYSPKLDVGICIPYTY